LPIQAGRETSSYW